MTFRSLAFAGLAFLAAIGGAQGAVITNGFTYAVASGSDQSTGTHYHSSTNGDYGNPSGLAEVGSYYNEEIRGLSEYNLGGLSTASSAYVTFDTYSTGLFGGVNNFPFSGTIDIYAYQGNNQENIGDYHAATSAYVGSFSTIGLTVGTVFSFDILSIFNDAIDNAWASLGIRLQTEDNVIDGGAWTFNDFRLTTTDDSTNVPEPATAGLVGLGLLGLALRRRRRRQA